MVAREERRRELTNKKRCREGRGEDGPIRNADSLKQLYNWWLEQIGRVIDQ